MEQIEKRILLQKDTYEKIEKAYSNYKKSPKERITIGYVQGRMDTLDNYWKEFKIVHEKILLSISVEDRQLLPYFSEDMFDQFEELFYTYKGELRTVLLKLSSETAKVDTSKQTVSNTSTSNSEVRLPRISIPTFNGNYTEWQSFHDLFVALIHNNSSLENVQKLHYLKSSLTGDAEVLLRQFCITGENYTEAWAILKKRYNNKRYIANTVFKKFFGQRELSQESASAIKQLLDTTVECMNVLKNLGLPTDQWDAIVTFVVISKLDVSSHKQWEETISEDSCDGLPGFERLKQFLETRFRTLEMVEPANRSYKQPPSVKPKSFHTTASNDDLQCTFCKEKHYIHHCKQFSKLPIEERYSYVQCNNLCFNCLIPNHTVFKCKQRTTCQICKRKHHSLLHREKKTVSEDKQVTTATKEDPPAHTNEEKFVTKVTAHVASGEQPDENIWLATALVDVTSSSGQSHVFRALIDPGSEVSLVTSRVVDLLGLKKNEISGVMFGVGEGNRTSLKHLVDLQITSRYDTNFSFNVNNAYVLRSITRLLPEREIRGYTWPQLKDIQLADPTFNVPGRIDILLSAKIYAKIMDNGLIRGPGDVIAQHTRLGWILSGDIEVKSSRSHNVRSFHITRQVEEDNNLLRKFWELETELYTTKKAWSKEEESCEEIYKNTTVRDETGRYEVHLPLKQTKEETIKLCGETKQQAITRFQQIERKFQRNGKLKEEYTKVINEYLNLGHMKKVEKEDEREAIYLAHHPVIREDKDTTKVRIVYDASSKGSNGRSLNDSMLVGPTLQPDLRSLIIRWRCHKICVVGDIVKMYRQVKMTNNHTDLQRIVWRDEASGILESYQLLTVTFGTAAAPWLAVRTLLQLADDESERYPRGAAVVKDSFYMDDLMTGHEDLSEMKVICNEVNKLLKAGGFHMQKWSSNSEELLKYLQEVSDSKETVNSLEIKLDKVIKILGLTWDRNEDTFKITVNLPELRNPVTKRLVLSDVASLFDPLGWLAPVVITAKVMIQKLWLCNHGWDEELPAEIVNEWVTYRDELNELQMIGIPRWMKITAGCKDIQLHGFADASSVAYAAVAYVRVLSIPKLELCAAVLLAKLLHELSNLLKIPMEKTYAWTDSMVVLAWLQSQPSRWQVFVGNRVSEIIQIIDNDRWRHVQSRDNPADLASRGIRAREIVDNGLWWTGPEWLKDKDTEFTRVDILPTSLEMKKTFHINLGDTPIWERFSSLTKLKRVLAQCRRFINWKNKTSREDYLTAAEMEEIEMRCIRYYQYSIYEDEIKDLKKNGKIKAKSSLITLTPYLDERGLLRVGGRLNNSSIAEQAKHPIIIPSKQHITKLLIKEAHLRTLHGDILAMMTYIRSKYWIISLKAAVRQVTHSCRTCIVEKAKTQQQLMGQLPAPRVTPHRAFLNSGVDYAGPVQLRTSKGRGHTSTKGYICLFICMSTRAIHLEAVTDLTAQAFIAAFRRFVARRGRCLHLWSDNGTNFVKADKELRDMFAKSNSSVTKEIAELLANDGTTWHFIPPKAPNFGGLWEAGVRSVKRHLNRVNGTSKLTYEEMATQLAQIESCCNSRPLSHLDETLDTLNPLTPGHFLIGEPVTSVPDINYENRNVNMLTRWQLIQKQTQDFWRRWKAEYLNTLQQRYKWQDTVNPPTVGDIVVIKEDDMPPAKWLLGKITALHTGPDQLVRVVTVQCKGNNLLKRPLSKLVLLPKHPDN
ncbi:uncharacterized protein LOC134801610 [Cydia splendana]|uniref:uncharacterized protein LOC134801610 n=1 Tax=Cydia splendana TaxID=1100963 RepID=UPI00300C720E